jgi:hypothetical protein
MMVIAVIKSNTAIIALQRPQTTNKETAMLVMIKAIPVSRIMRFDILIFDSYDNPKMIEKKDIMNTLIPMRYYCLFYAGLI